MIRRASRYHLATLVVAAWATGSGCEGRIYNSTPGNDPGTPGGTGGSRTTGGSGTRTCASAAAVDDRAGFTETERNAATGATRGAGDKCDATVE